jgi:hypothetical protein
VGEVTYSALLPTKAGNLVLKTFIIFLKPPVITPGFVKSFKISTPASFGLFLSSFLARGKGIAGIKDFRNEGVESKREERWALELLRKVLRSV